MENCWQAVLQRNTSPSSVTVNFTYGRNWKKLGVFASAAVISRISTSQKEMAKPAAWATHGHPSLLSLSTGIPDKISAKETGSGSLVRQPRWLPSDSLD